MTITSWNVDWEQTERAVFADGHALVPAFLPATSCAQLREWFERDELFRSRIIMEAHGYGRGEYRYFAYPLPELVAALRGGLYAALAPIANRWMQALGAKDRFPPSLQLLLDTCFAAGQTRPTALLLRYHSGDYNALHQDLYGHVAFPFQATIFLSAPGADYTGGEFILVEQRPRMQSRAEVIAPGLGDLLIFPNRYRPADGVRRKARTQYRHGVSRVRSGERYALGLIFHDAQ